MRAGKFNRLVHIAANSYDGRTYVQDDNAGVLYPVLDVSMSNKDGTGDLIIHISPNQPIPVSAPIQMQPRSEPPYHLPLQKDKDTDEKL